MQKCIKTLKPFKIAIPASIAILLLCCTWSLSIAAQRDKEYIAKQITNITIDGDLGEWELAEVVAFDQLKDAGANLPKATDFTGHGRVAWNVQDPTRIYFAVEITDDELQDIHPENSNWWEDDSVEFMFDFENHVIRDSIVQWTLGANGKDLSAAASPDNTEWIVIKNGDHYIYEVAIDPTKPRGNPEFANPDMGTNFKARNGLTIGLSFHMNDCEGGIRQHQIGWRPGTAWDPLAFGDLTFDNEIFDVKPAHKLTVTWGNLKQR